MARLAGDENPLRSRTLWMISWRQPLLLTIWSPEDIILRIVQIVF